MNAFDIKPEWLVYLRTVAQEKSIRTAAEKLYLTEQTLRYNLKGLEDMLQAALLVSGESGLELTSQGHALLANGGAFLDQLGRTRQKLAALSMERPEFRLAVSYSYACEPLGPLLQAMYRQFNGLQMSLQLDTPREIEKQVFLGVHQVGLITWAPTHPRMTVIKGPVSPGVYVRRSQAPVAPVYLLPKIWRYSKYQDLVYPDEVENYPVRYLGRIAMIRALCLQGAGIGYLPRAHIQSELEAGILVETLGPPLEFSLLEHLVIRDLEHLSAPARWFVDQMRQRWKADAPP